VSNKNGGDIQVVVFAACEEMLREDIPVTRITGRKVATRPNVDWSHTTVTPHVNKWHEQRSEKEREAIKQTRMSKNFVTALHREVEDRISTLRVIDDEQVSMLQVELQDMIDTNKKIESELTNTKRKLAGKNEDASQALAALKQSEQDKSKAEDQHRASLSELQTRYDNEVSGLKSTIEKNLSTYSSERAEYKAEVNEAIRKLTEKNDELHSDLNSKIAECAEASIKAENFNKLVLKQEACKNENVKLSGDNIRLNAELETKQNALLSAEQTSKDCKFQRDKAQLSREQTEIELKALQVTHQDLLVKAVSAGVRFTEK